MKKVIVILSLLIFCIYGCKSQQKIVSNKTTTTEAKVVQTEAKEQKTNVVNKSTIDTKQDEIVIVVDDSLSLSQVAEIKGMTQNQIPDFGKKVKVKEIRIKTSTQSENNNVAKQIITNGNKSIESDINERIKEQVAEKQKAPNGFGILLVSVLFIAFVVVVLFFKS